MLATFFEKNWLLVVLAVLAFTAHFAFLSYPAQVVFDEVHFGKFVSAYFTGQYYFDIHPPLGKLLIAGWARLNGVNPVFAFEHIGEQIPQKILFTLRFLPAFFGGLFVLVFAWLAYLISRSKTVAMIAGFLVLLDNAFLVQSKFILVDIFLLFFTILTFCFFFLYQRQKSFSAKWFIWLILTGISFGLAVSIKWTGLATIGIIGVILFAKIFSKKLRDYFNTGNAIASPDAKSRRGNPVTKSAPGYNTGLLRFAPNCMIQGFAGNDKLGAQFKKSLTGLLFLLTISFVVYAIPFAIHFKLLPRSGPGDAFMSQLFQRELKYGREATEQPLSFWQKFTELNKTMYQANAGITADHPFGSRWYSWPLGKKPIYYWTQEQTNHIAKIYLAGNFFLWWLAVGAVLFALIKAITKKGQGLGPIYFILILAYFANLLPFILVKRVSFLYHYLPAVNFAILLLSLWLAKLWPKQKIILALLFIFITVGFILLLPLTYGWLMPAWLDRFEALLVSFFASMWIT